MGFRFYRSIRLGKGIRLNLSKTGFGISAGVPGARVSLHSSGRTVKTVGIPGTGVYYRKDSRIRSGAARSKPRSRPTPPPIVVPRHPGLFASRSERGFYRGLLAYTEGDHASALKALQEASAGGTPEPSIELFSALSLIALDRVPEAEPLLRRVIASDTALPDELSRKYAASGVLQVQVTPSVQVNLALDRGGAALMLAEVLQHMGRDSEAIELLETLGSVTGDRVVALSLADLYEEQQDWRSLVRVTEGSGDNDGDLGLQLLVLRMRGLRETGDPRAARALSKEGLRFRKRDAALLLGVRFERALALTALGKGSLARKDLERIYEEDPGFADVATRLGRPAAV